MAYFGDQITLGTLTATADYSSATSQYTVVYPASATTATKQTSAGGIACGILQNLPASGSACTIAVAGVSKARVNVADSISVGDKVCASTGAGVKASTAVGLFVIGRALSATTTTGIITVLLTMEGAGSSGAAGAA